MRRAPRLVALAAALLAACATTPGPAPTPSPGPEGTEIHAPRYLVERPTFFVEGDLDGAAFRRWAAEIPLPAISEDGAWVALGRRGEDGARGNPNYAVEVMRVADGRSVGHAPILAADEVDRHRGDPGFEAVVRDRVDRANDMLAAYRWAGRGERLEDLSSVGMDHLAGAPFKGPLGLAIGALTVVFDEPHLSVRLAGRVLVDADYPGWTQPETNLCGPDHGSEGGEECACRNPITLRGGRVDLARGVLLLDIGYVGTDLCWEPDTWTAVIALPRND
ncbi:MAG: hypothetical protein EP329_09470 [Deltaproteobacteria bacterium]|nr:MAG: hypothetical protein EP329_09470 [Deltaproteobacteria bacterium]